MTCLFSVGPHFPQNPQNLTVKEGGPATLSCLAEGAPLPTVRWTRKSNTYLEPPTMLTNEREEFTLLAIAYWNNTNRSDTGYYRCVAYNGIGGNVFSDWAYLNVQCKLLCLNYIHFSFLPRKFE